MSVHQSFDPNYGTGQSVTTTGASQSLTLTSNPKQVCITNMGVAVIYARIDAAAITTAATAADMPILPSGQRTLSKRNSDPQNTPPVVKIIGAAGSLVHVIEGEGNLY